MITFKAKRKDNGQEVSGDLIKGKYICTDIEISPFFSGEIRYVAPCMKEGQLINKSVPMNVLVPRMITLYEILPSTIQTIMNDEKY